jgi:hypothetical protein
MRTGMTRLETYLGELEAEIALGRLLALGVTAVLEKDDCGGMRPHLNLQQGVRLLVADADLEKARGILAAPAEVSPSPPWTCPACGENIESGFDACWQCGHQQS